jgi:hypothetical protein
MLVEARMISDYLDTLFILSKSKLLILTLVASVTPTVTFFFIVKFLNSSLNLFFRGELSYKLGLFINA